MQFLLKGKPCVIHGIVPGSIASGDIFVTPKCFAVVGEVLGHCAMVMSSPSQVVLSTEGCDNADQRL